MNSQSALRDVQQIVADLKRLDYSTDALRTLHQLSNVVELAKAELTREMSQTGDYEVDGYASARAWLRAELQVDARTASQLIRAGSTLAELPALDEATANGTISLDHVQHFGYGLKHAGDSATREVLPELIEVAANAEPGALRHAVRHLREAVYPDALDQAWIDGMAREDLQVNPVPEGWHVNGFLNSTTGAKLNTLLQSLSTPAGADDPRPSAQRRVDGLEQLLDSVLANGLPGDQGVRPHVNLTIDIDHLKNETGAGELVGFGRIGIRQVTDLLCDADITPVIVRPTDGSVLDVGRRFRLATKRQRSAIEVRQHHRCAAPGCSAPVVDIHHIVWWSQGGQTSLDNLIGLCPRCHRAVHAGTLVIDPTTHQFTSKSGRLLAGHDPWDRPRRRLNLHRRRLVAEVKSARSRRKLPVPAADMW